MSSPTTGRWLKRALFVGATLQLLLIGYLASPQAASTGSGGMLTAGRLTVVHDEKWSQARSGDALEGIRLRQGGSLVHEDGSRAEIGTLGRVGGPAAPLESLFPAGVPEAGRVELGGTPALAYRSTSAAGVTALYEFSLSDGERLAIACRTATAHDVCTPLAASADVDGVADAGPNAALAAAMRAAIKTVSGIATDGAQARLRARRSRARADGARRMAGAYAGLAQTTDALARRPENASDQAGLFRIAGAAQGVAAAFRALASAARRTNRPEFERRLVQLRARQAALRKALLALRDRGYEVHP